MELLCDLCDDFDLEGDALGMVISLIDQLCATRRDLHALAGAIADELAETRARIAATVLKRDEAVQITGGRRRRSEPCIWNVAKERQLPVSGAAWSRSLV